ncbi:hypothetical protein [Dactylosporangium roseum]|uniref:hypothetical protein n=1 Tax=Dactylosporangium roseum TaxID=47989 RepID=UPI0021B47F20|nr:hypothetical protein [Dactylosporangium roseum]
MSTRRHARFAGLSCYTANLAAYLDAEVPDVGAALARSVRLAVRAEPAGGLAFSHHNTPLDRVGDGTVLRYATLPHRAALVGLADELSRRGRVLLVTDGSRLPWSPSRHRGTAAPHWLLVTGRRGDAWHVLDAFAGLLPGGEQRPYTGWLSTAGLTRAAALPEAWTAEQHMRDAMAFGHPVVPPALLGPLWLRREAEPGPPAPLGGDWIAGDAEALPFLAERFVEAPERAARHLDDVWTAAMHRMFRYRWLLTRPELPAARRDRLTAAHAAWEQLPSALRFAVDSARRGRPRPSLVRQTFTNLLDVDPGEEELLTATRREAP